MPLTKDDNCGKMAPRLHLGSDEVLKFAYRKGKRTYTRKLVRVCDGTVYVLDPSTKKQVVVGRALWVGDVLVIAMAVRRE